MFKKVLPLLVVFSITISACEKDNPTSTNTNNTSNIDSTGGGSPNEILQFLTGDDYKEWFISDISYNGETLELENCNSDDIFVINKDGSFELNEGETKCSEEHSQIISTGKWILGNNNEKLSIIETIENETYTTAFNIDELSEDVFILSIKYDEDTYIYSYSAKPNSGGNNGGGNNNGGGGSGNGFDFDCHYYPWTKGLKIDEINITINNVELVLDECDVKYRFGIDTFDEFFEDLKIGFHSQFDEGIGKTNYWIELEDLTGTEYDSQFKNGVFSTFKSYNGEADHFAVRVMHQKGEIGNNNTFVIASADIYVDNFNTSPGSLEIKAVSRRTDDGLKTMRIEFNDLHCSTFDDEVFVIRGNITFSGVTEEEY